MNNTKQERELNRESQGSIDVRTDRSASFGRTAFWVLITAVCYYLSTQIAWALCFPGSKVSLFFPPHAVLVSVLLIVPVRHWWAYTLAAICSHFVATQQAHWPPFYALHCEVFDAVQNVLVAAGLRIFIKSPLTLISLRDAIVFVLIAVVLVPFGAAFWGAAFTISNHFGTHYWIEWRNLGISNAVTAVVLVPAFLFGVRHLSTRRVNATPARLLEAGLLGASILTAGVFAFDKTSAGPDAMPILLYAPIPLLIWAALRFGLGGISASMLVITFQAIWGTMHGHGPFLTQTPAENTLALQIFLLVLAIPLMFLAVIVEEEKRSKVALLESEERLILAAEAAEFGVWVWNITSNQIWGTETWRRLFGFASGEDIGFEKLFQRIHPEDREMVQQEIKCAATGETDHLREYRVILPDGTQRWVASQGRMRQDVNGKDFRMFGVAIEITGRKQTEIAMHDLSRRLIRAHEAERARLGRELHDDVTQRLAMLAIETGRLERGADKDMLAKTLREIREGLVRLSEDIHALSYRLHPALLEDLGLAEALKAECERFSRQESVPAEVTVRDLPDDISADVALCLFRVTQEALRNVARHAKAHLVEISLQIFSLRTLNDNLQLVVHDDGIGFDPTLQRARPSLGLESMRERVFLVDGQLHIESTPGQGTTILVTVPLKKADGQN